MAQATAVFNNLSNRFLALKILPSEYLIVFLYRCVISASGPGPGPHVASPAWKHVPGIKAPADNPSAGAASPPGTDSQYFLQECGIRNAVSLAQERESL